MRELYNITDERTLVEKYKILHGIYENDRPYIGLYFNSKTNIYSKTILATIGKNCFNIFYDINDWNKKS